MKTSITFHETFETAHQVPLDTLCGSRLHGHSWYATATVTGTPDPTDGSIKTPAAEYLWASVQELHKKSANDMLPGLFPTPEGIAGWLFERLRLECSGLQSITVGFPGRSATVEV